MPKIKSVDVVYNYHNTVVISNNNLQKTFMTVEQLNREKKFHDLFSNFFNVPKIRDINIEAKTICYEYIKGHTLKEPKI